MGFVACEARQSGDHTTPLHQGRGKEEKTVGSGPCSRIFVF